MVYIINDGTEKEIEVGMFVEIGSMFGASNGQIFEVLDAPAGANLLIKLNEQEVWLSSIFINSVWRKV